MVVMRLREVRLLRERDEHVVVRLLERVLLERLDPQLKLTGGVELPFGFRSGIRSSTEGCRDHIPGQERDHVGELIAGGIALEAPDLAPRRYFEHEDGDADPLRTLGQLATHRHLRAELLRAREPIVQRWPRR